MAAPPSELTFLSGPPSEVDATAASVFVGSKAALQGEAVQSLVKRLLPAAGDVWASLVDSAAGVSADAGGTATTWVPSSTAGGAASKLSVAVLPSACSRHN